ncbi:MAG: hypothetical protein DME25_18740 [Verrucomicrobia bacterium]|nr:MAG: hypothetical protein DME25_18740 [Verrucomicrobiota bacterium]
MTPAQLRNLARDPRFIPGIYNYCDRWCERCPLSHRCLTYATEKFRDREDQAAAADNPEARARDNQKFWDKIHASFQLTMQMVKEDAQRLGIDLEAPGALAEAAAHERQVRRRAARHRPLARAARDYGFAVQKWCQESGGLFKAKGVELEQQARLEIGRPLAEAEEIHELLDIIQWYHLFIHVKLSRAIESQAEEEMETDPELKSLMNDGDGSAKIALIGMDRSLAAWTGLRAHFMEQEDAILDFQLQLARIRQQAEKLFPNARGFVRPGFDEDDGKLERGG